MCEQAKQIAEALKGHRGRLIVTSHVRPDGDAVGSALGLTLGLQAAGCEALCVGVEPIAEEFRTLVGADAMVSAADYVPRSDDAIVAVDCGDKSRISQSLRERLGQGDGKELDVQFCIDHHKSNMGFGTWCWVEGGASSTAELILAILEAGNFPLTSGIADALWVGVVTDTGRFSYASATNQTFQMAGKLVAAGARFVYWNERIFCENPIRRLRLQQRLLAHLEVTESGRVAIAQLGAEDYASQGCTAADSENFVDLVRSVQGTWIGAFLRQVESGGPVYISLRTDEPYDAAEICATWGGGGHARAAGATVSGRSLADVYGEVRATLEATVAHHGG